MKSNLFFALRLSEVASAAIHRDAQQWQGAAQPGAAKWHAPGDYHVTLKFLGAHEPCEIDAFAGLIGDKIAREWAKDEQGAIPMELAGAGAFPSLQAPRVLWAGVLCSKALAELAARIDEACAELGVPLEERKYKPHVTLARVRDTRGKSALFEPAYDLFQSVLGFRAKQFFLMQTSPPESRKLGGQLRYNIVHTFDLDGQR